ncbi:MFS transporter [Leptospirillum ferriphilum]|jgi:MHS family proline/betaine transporter-like MFS transporter|uniref:Major facilitator superfamily (MFS) profile domain-containing protein n=3 Tax=Leptospirillum ferriphilum TaxID=178606 RepID=A0A059XNL9_9BACT|nr:MFS transporter [Leptospirillum ferriphilum]AFS52961.1 permease of the major facilitator superfamily [Leptospirillum ferriphilum ML-04]AIA30129.1 hypothetical protein Y981_02945 [Leptospirillum ferriphilum YSK]OOH73363.1 hypothetical protein BOX24_04710 [Leptospirillum ferriphilum]OOH80746.1 hypothetical protein BOX30_05240 [Leptospirillum ferriphilum]
MTDSDSLKKSLSPGSVLAANIVGNVLEWYDFALYGSFATLFARVFFPPGNGYLSLLETFGAFAAGYVSRPVGGLLFGHAGDTRGRKRALIFSILLMSVPTVLVGLLPGYREAGLLSPVLLVLLRILQGLAIGGEFSLVMSFLVETAPFHKRGYHGSWALVGVVAGILLGTLSALSVSMLLGPDRLASWGWRIPFLAGLLLTGAGLYLRRHLPESPAFRPEERDVSPFLAAVRGHGREMAKGFGFLVTNSIAFYTIVIYQPAFLAGLPGSTLERALTVQVLGLIALLFLVPLAGHLSDRIGRKPVTLLSAAGFFLLSPFLYRTFVGGTSEALLTGEAVFLFLLALYIGPLPSILTEIFPSNVRCSALSVTYNVNLALFGGTTPLVVTWLSHHFHDRTAAGDLLSVAALVSFFSILLLDETRFSPLP